MNIQGRIAIVTGATQGLGRDIAERLHEAGASVVITGRDEERGAELAARLGARAAFIPADLEDDDTLDVLLKETIKAFGGLDILVHNACLYADNGHTSTRAEWLKSLNVNLVGAAVLSAKALRYLAAPGGVIVHIGSVGGKFGVAGRALYPAGKAALHQYTKNLAVSLAPRGIRVLSISPAWTWSPALENMAGSIETADRVGAQLHPLGRVGRGRDVGDAVLFACSEMAGFISGIDLPVDGGFSILGPDQGQSPGKWFAMHRTAKDP